MNDNIPSVDGSIYVLLPTVLFNHSGMIFKNINFTHISI